jgi:hypothetical protein
MTRTTKEVAMQDLESEVAIEITTDWVKGYAREIWIEG